MASVVLLTAVIILMVLAVLLSTLKEWCLDGKSYGWLAGSEGRERRRKLLSSNGNIGTTVRIHSFIPS